MLVEIRKSDGPVGFDGNYLVADYSRAHFLAAYLDEKPVGQVCLVNDGLFWWTDSLVVHPKLRNTGLALHLIEANYHHALENDITLVLARARKDGVVEAQTFRRNNDRMHLGATHEITHDANAAFFVRRDLTELRAKIERGEVQKITFPYQVEVHQRAQSA